ncbi:MAG: signal peptidase II [Caulobacterales bacterium]|nr:signal peptidase II [Caulobacterales bacterium]
MAVDAIASRPTPAARFGLAVMAAVIIADQLTKWAILHLARLSPPGCLETGAGCRRIELSPLVDLTMVWNYGVSFGLFKSDGAGRWALMAFAVGVAAFFGRWLLKSERRLAAAGLGAIVGGAIGNLIDRAAFGAVVDFIDFSGPWFGWTIGGWGVVFPYVFNVADAAINVGVALFLIDTVLDGKRDRN